ncbi:MAG: helix-turn-helix domain-containing protein [Acidimicrobiales bacterium]|nr:DUF4115 domain-containing protein [Hyphomonadaceae bacterium]RZV40673.1 MAG: helix-turn-helix domain-containing protein [Acidimicrobiales bacterium]
MSADIGANDGTNMHIGAELKAARQNAGLSYDDINNALHIQPQYLSAIENLKVDDLPSLGYVLGFIRTYANHLGLDPKDAVERYKTDIKCPVNLGLRDRPHYVPKRKIRLPRGTFAASAVLSCALVAVSWYGSQTTAQSAQFSEQPTLATENFGLEPVGPTQGNPNTVSLVATHMSFIQVRNKNGKELISRIMLPNELFESEKKDVPIATIRDAGAFDLYIGGVRVGPLGPRGESVKNLDLSTVEIPLQKDAQLLTE